jgi:hypothetical protein
MDWLERHKAVLDCYEKSLKYKDENDTVRTVQGIQKPVSVRQISAMQFKKCMRKGCQVYAIQVTNLLEKENKPNLEDFVILHDFRDVFVDEIPELPPRREIDFSIDLLPGSTPISKAPYRMSLPRINRIKNSTTRIIGQRIYQTECFTMGSTSPLCEKERQNSKIMHRLQTIKQNDY